MKYSDIKKQFPEFDKVALRYIEDTYKRYYENHLRCSDKVWMFLFTTNAGGAVAILSFIGSSKTSISPKPIISLCIYTLGVILVGILMALAYHRSLNAVISWSKKIEEFYKNNIEWGKLAKPEETKMSKFVDVIVYIVAYGSFFCFIVGSIIGGRALFS